MKYLFLTLSAIFIIGCGTVDCNKCPVVVKTKVITPTISCYRPEPYEEFQKSLLSTSGVESEGKLFEIIATNVKLMEKQIKLWEGYRKCVDDIIISYKENLELDKKDN